MEFGVFDHLDRGSLPLNDYYEARLPLIEGYDRAGFHVYHVAAGTPDTVLRFLTTRLSTAGANYCINRFAFGDLTLAESMRSVDLFVKDVRPALLKALE